MVVILKINNQHNRAGVDSTPARFRFFDSLDTDAQGTGQTLRTNYALLIHFEAVSAFNPTGLDFDSTFRSG